MKVEEMVLEGIAKIARDGNTDFESGFDRLFEFMAENPERQTTKNFISFHIVEMNSPVLEDGTPDFTYLVGEKFVAEDWVNEDDMEAFQEYVLNWEQ